MISQVRVVPQHVASSLALMASLVCLANFALDILAIAWSPAFSSIEWRMGSMQQLGERCIILLLGSALLCYGLQTLPTLLHRTAWFLCALGLCLGLSGIFYLQDSGQFQSVAIANLSQQQQSLEQRIQQTASQQTSALAANQPIQTERAVQLLRERTKGLQLRAGVQLRKTVLRTCSSLFLASLGLLVLGIRMMNLQDRWRSLPKRRNYPYKWVRYKWVRQHNPLNSKKKVI